MGLLQPTGLAMRCVASACCPSVPVQSTGAQPLPDGPSFVNVFDLAGTSGVTWDSFIPTGRYERIGWKAKRVNGHAITFLDLTWSLTTQSDGHPEPSVYYNHREEGNWFLEKDLQLPLVPVPAAEGTWATYKLRLTSWDTDNGVLEPATSHQSFAIKNMTGWQASGTDQLRCTVQISSDDSIWAIDLLRQAFPASYTVYPALALPYEDSQSRNIPFGLGQHKWVKTDFRLTEDGHLQGTSTIDNVQNPIGWNVSVRVKVHDIYDRPVRVVDASWSPGISPGGQEYRQNFTMNAFDHAKVGWSIDLDMSNPIGSIDVDHPE